MSLRRGFKASSNRISIRLRRGQGLSPEDPIDLEIVATRLNITIVPLSQFAAEHPPAVRQLFTIDPGAFSAATLQINGDRRVLVHNDSHDSWRQRS